MTFVPQIFPEPKVAAKPENLRFSWEENPFANDPCAWIAQDEFLWSKQREVANSVCHNRYTAVHSAHGTGKSFIASRLVAWWLSVHKVGDAFVVTTAPTATQVRAILWREIYRTHTARDLPGYIALGDVPEWKIGKELIAYGRKPADYTDPHQAAATFSGIHARHVLIILDEAGGIPEWLWNAVDTLATNEHARVLAIGNPDDPATQFEKVCRPGSGWNTLHISAFDLPAFTGEEVPEELNEVLTGKTWVEERKKRWGEQSPIYISKVLGIFPDISDDTLIPPGLIRKAIERNLPGFEPGQFGADVARYGKDKSMVYRNRGGVLRKIKELHRTDTMETAGHFKNIIMPFANRVPMVIDVNGLGAGVFDRLREQNMNVIPFNNGEGAIDKKRFKNKRAETFWALRELFENEAIDIDDLDEDLQAQLGSIMWKLDSSGKIQVESKDDIIKRIGVSPDHADAAAMSCVNNSMANIEEWLANREKNKKSGITDDLLGAPT